MRLLAWLHRLGGGRGRPGAVRPGAHQGWRQEERLVEIGRGIGRGGDGFAAGAAAARQALDGAARLPVAALLVYGSVRYALDRVVQGVRSVAPTVPLLGASGAREVLEGLQQDSVGVVAIASEHLAVRSGVGRDVSRGWGRALDEALATPALARWFDGSPEPWAELDRTGRSAFAILLAPGPTALGPPRTTELLEELQRRCGYRLPVVGAAASDDGRLEQAWVLHGDTALPDAVLVAVVETRLKVGLATAHGLRPGPARATVTRTEGAEVVELDGRPAAAAVAALFGAPLPSHQAGGQGAAARLPRRLRRCGSPTWPPPPPTGRPSASSGRSSPARCWPAWWPTRIRPPRWGATWPALALERGGIRTPAVAITFGCIARARLLGEAVGRDPQELSEQLGGAPVVGFRAAGQIGPVPDGRTWSTVGVVAALVLGDELSTAARVALQNETLRREVEQWFLALGQSNAALMRANAELRDQVAERQRVEDGLRQAQGRQRALLDGVEDLAWFKDVSGRYVAANRTLAEAVGLSSDAVVGLSDADLWEPQLAERLARDHRQVVEAGTVERRRETLVTSYGVKVPVEIIVTPVLDEQGQALGTAGVARDVSSEVEAERLRWQSQQELERRVWERTAELERVNRSLEAELARRSAAEAERRSLEKQLRQAQKMDAMGRLAGGVAHDFNNIVTVILSAAHALRQAPQDAAELADEIRSAGERAGALTRQLLAFSRQQAVEPRALAPDELVRGFLKMLDRLLGSHIRIEVSLRSGAAQVCADPGQLEQVLLNLAVNARDAMPKGGRLQVETDLPSDAEPDLPGNAPGPGPWLRLSVADSGCGMSEDVLQRVFEPFFTTKAKGHGTGLGLATVFGIVKQAGGFITVDSQPGAGSVFRVYLPRLAERPSPRPSRPPPPPPPPAATARWCSSPRTTPTCGPRWRGSWPARATGRWWPPRPRRRPASSTARATGWTCSSPTSSSPTSPAPTWPAGCGLRRPGLRLLFTTGHTDASPALEEAAAAAPVVRKPFTAGELLGAVRTALDARPVTL